MIKCPSCAFENPEDGKFCTNCGKTILLPPAAPEGPARFCTDCGGKIPADSKFCTACGKPFGAEGVPIPAAGQAAPLALDYLAALDGRLAQNGF